MRQLLEAMHEFNHLDMRLYASIHLLLMFTCSRGVLWCPNEYMLMAVPNQILEPMENLLVEWISTSWQ